MNEKKCPKCGEIRDLSFWGKNKAKSDGLQSQCKLCVKDYNKEYYIRTPEKNPARRARTVIQCKVLQSIVKEYLEKNPCVDCGNSDIRVLEFDHVRGKKKFNIGTILNSGTSIQTLIDEIDKCEVRCANCHRIATLVRAGVSWRLFP